jgi:hypothetical protein
MGGEEEVIDRVSARGGERRVLVILLVFLEIRLYCRHQTRRGQPRLSVEGDREIPNALGYRGKL